MTILAFDGSGRTKACVSILASSGLLGGFEQAFVLPIPSVDGDKIKGTDTGIDELIGRSGVGTLVAGYGLPPEVTAALHERGAVVCDCMGEEQFLLANGYLTADACVGIILTTENRAPKDLKIGVVGYGRIGKRLVEELLYLGAEVKVYTTRRETALELCADGISAEISSKDACLSGLDILINTAPAVIFDTMPEGLRVIDLASGDNFPGIAVEKYPSVPAKMFPYSSGRIYGEAVERLALGGVR